MADRRNRVRRPDFSGAPEMTHPLIERLTQRAEEMFAASTDKKAPQWSRKANAHAWAGMVNAIHIAEAWLGEHGDPGRAKARKPEGLATVSVTAPDGKSTPGMPSNPSPRLNRKQGSEESPGQPERLLIRPLSIRKSGASA